jgi:hypothetical protein
MQHVQVLVRLIEEDQAVLTYFPPDTYRTFTPAAQCEQVSGIEAIQQISEFTFYLGKVWPGGNRWSL